jgi:hypothetical protein
MGDHLAVENHIIGPQISVYYLNDCAKALIIDQWKHQKASRFILPAAPYGAINRKAARRPLEEAQGEIAGRCGKTVDQNPVLSPRLGAPGESGVEVAPGLVVIPANTL